MAMLMPLFAAALVVRRRYLLHRCAQAVSCGAARCASQVLDRGAHADARGATHVLDRGVHDAGFNSWFSPAARSAKTDACTVASRWCRRTQVSRVGLRLG